MLTPVNPPAGGFPGVSLGMRISGGDLLILSGHVGTLPNGELAEGFEAQLRATYENIKATLHAAGAGFEAVARLTHYVVDFDPSMLAILRSVRSEYINNDAPPSAALIPLVKLYDKAVLLEVDGFAVLPERRRID
ncbi:MULTISPECIES: RidA family protein [Paraburkholderia]|uniref:RidA family protein n=1 Tax=Paraburkholderia podalyriae TaxID=1938811 RepID=A0ABR7PZH9_9BURK|nr:RidA family protein [Paraburkholderia podalyriae]MBC8751696.1 RidA family protein [Paraburkholderia podalyriae]